MSVSGINVFGLAANTTSVTADTALTSDDPAGFPLDYVALDLETTGLNPSSSAITEIGAVRVRGGRIIDRFQQLINPLRPIPSRITALTGITNEMVAGLDPIDEVFPRFLSWIAEPGAENERTAGEPIVGHNVSFDLRFLNYNAQRIAGVDFACVDYDTMQISRTLFPDCRHHKLVDLIQRFGIADTEEHRALSDAIQTQQCFEWMRQYTCDNRDLGTFDWRIKPATTSPCIINRQLTLR
ncbi:3'-5' exonuclease [Bifidobacterium oedipodis]|uniref:DNA polymerase III subunit epsilon n=1 Tax=Bifidobacterium oedipodis TaxID=2675322 RepID=A0A7Y0EMA3_9BIFI|nr:DNA polymerase III subunit epsilon [Bifidobacterium sp. DSM 109957]